jgi:hypothetical protein
LHPVSRAKEGFDNIGNEVFHDVDAGYANAIDEMI